MKICDQHVWTNWKYSCKTVGLRHVSSLINLFFAETKGFVEVLFDILSSKKYMAEPKAPVQTVATDTAESANGVEKRRSPVREVRPPRQNNKDDKQVVGFFRHTCVFIGYIYVKEGRGRSWSRSASPHRAHRPQSRSPGETRRRRFDDRRLGDRLGDIEEILKWYLVRDSRSSTRFKVISVRQRSLSAKAKVTGEKSKQIQKSFSPSAAALLTLTPRQGQVKVAVFQRGRCPRYSATIFSVTTAATTVCSKAKVTRLQRLHADRGKGTGTVQKDSRQCFSEADNSVQAALRGLQRYGVAVRDVID